jgi:GNAT superfamily N-acetyltransferase
MFYRHYKGMNYRLMFTVRHSETLEELEVYETLYRNERGRFWVRPKAMFHEDIEINGERRPRFAKLSVRMTSEAFTADILKTFQPLATRLFPDLSENKIHERLKGRPTARVFLAWIDQTVIGFKLGYRQNEDTFYSWLGGVDPLWRKGGIGRRLSEMMLKECSEVGYDFVETKSTSQWPDMVALNMKLGFEVVGFESNEGRPTKLVFRKSLDL